MTPPEPLPEEENLPRDDDASDPEEDATVEPTPPTTGDPE